MKKTSKTLFLVGAILGIFLAIVWLIVAIVYSVAAGAVEALIQNPLADIPQEVRDFINQLMKSLHVTTLKELAAILAAYAVVFWIMFVCSIAGVVLSFVCKAKEKPALALLIVATAFSLFGGLILSVAGGIVGIVNWAVVDRKEQPQA